MTLPEITLPKIDLPFDIPVLIHPSVDHFAIALPVVILLLEFYNLFTKRKSIGVFSFFLLILTIVIFAASYFTGLIDGKEAYDLLPQEGQTDLKAHKLLGTYLLLGSGLLLFLKLLAMTGKKLLKVLFFIGLIGFIVVTFEQGKEGGELVYKYGANVERVKNIDDKLFDAQEALEESQNKKSEKDVSEHAVTNTKEQEQKMQEEVTSEQKSSSEINENTQKQEEKMQVEVISEQKSSSEVNENIQKGTPDESTQLEEKISEVKEKLKNIDSTVKTSAEEVKEVTPEAKPLEESTIEEETVDTPNPTSVSHLEAQEETQEPVINSVSHNKEAIAIPAIPSVTEPSKVDESEESLVTKVGETIKDAASEENINEYKESLEGLAEDMKEFFKNK